MYGLAPSRGENSVSTYLLSASVSSRTEPSSLTYTSISLAFGIAALFGGRTTEPEGVVKALRRRRRRRIHKEAATKTRARLHPIAVATLMSDLKRCAVRSAYC